MFSQKDTNLVVFYGKKAVNLFPDMLRCWTEVLEQNDWRHMNFMLYTEDATGDFWIEVKEKIRSALDSDEQAYERIVSEEYLWYGSQHEPIPSGAKVLNWMQQRGPQVKAHIVWASKETAKQEFGPEDGKWISKLTDNLNEDKGDRQLKTIIYAMPTPYAQPAEKKPMLDLISRVDWSCIVGDKDDNFVTISYEDRVRAVALAILTVTVGGFTLSNDAKGFSLGYTVLNANGQELDRLCQLKACYTISEAYLSNQVMGKSDSLRILLPDGLENVDHFGEFLMSKAKERLQDLPSSVLDTLRITIGLTSQMTVKQAAERVKNFADVNMYQGKARTKAKEYADYIREKLSRELRRNITIGTIDISALRDVQKALQRVCEFEFGSIISGVKFPSQPGPIQKMFHSDWEVEYLAKRWELLKPVAKKYYWQKASCVFAQELLNVYQEMNEELNGEIRQQVTKQLAIISKSLEKGTKGSLFEKYKVLNNQLQNITLRPEEVIPHNWVMDLFDNRHATIQKNWKEFFCASGKRVRQLMKQDYPKDFAQAIQVECPTPEERKEFFAKYLAKGDRMLQSVYETAGEPQSRLFISTEFIGDIPEDEQISQVQSKNAERLTLYWICQPYALLDKNKEFFRDIGNLSRAEDAPAKKLIRRNDYTQQAKEENTDKPYGNVTLVPHGDRNYYLDWQWESGVQRYIVTATCRGSQLGKKAVADYSICHDNKHPGLNFTRYVMEGEELPWGELEITIERTNGEKYLKVSDVVGRRKLVMYEVKSLKNGHTELKVDFDRELQQKICLVLWQGETKYLYPLYTKLMSGFKSGLLSASLDVEIVTNPLNRPETDVYPVRHSNDGGK